MQGVDGAIGRHGPCSSGQGLTEDLATEHGAPAEILALTSEEVHLDRLEAQEVQELAQDWSHDDLRRPDNAAGGARLSRRPVRQRQICRVCGPSRA